MTHKPINITQAEALDGHRLRLHFDDGTEQIVDFGPFLTRARHPDIRKFLDAGRFATFRIEFGNLVWGDFELCFPIADLHSNAIESQAALEGQT